ncbi:hypothetical protein M5689_016829 [Euphorbia peplus]|nr:hypothetical protein M5689_016829 [Euphorbia peplus]
MAKQLKQLLQEKQEPFILELYLLEKGYFRNKFNSLDLKRSQKGPPKCSKLLKAVYKHLISINQRLKIKNSSPRDHVAQNKDKNDQETPESDSFSSDIQESETSTSQRSENITIRVTEVVTDRKLSCQCIEESRQLSPVLVSEEVAPNTGFLARHVDGRANLSSIRQKPKKVSEDSILSASLCKILFQSAREKSTLQELVHSNLSRQSLKSKKVVQQTRQLLFDCVREIVETQEKKKKQQKTQYLATQDQFGKLIEEKIKCWGKQYGQESKLECLLQLDIRDSAHEWIGYKQHGKKIGCEIGDTILDEIVNEITIEMAGF